VGAAHGGKLYLSGVKKSRFYLQKKIFHLKQTSLHFIYTKQYQTVISGLKDDIIKAEGFFLNSFPSI
jgi:hypothetical protein